MPPPARASTTLPRIDYEEAFLVEVGGVQHRTAEQWARAVLEDSPSRLRRNLRFGWSILGLQLGPIGCGRFVLGWELRRSTPDHALLGARSPVGLSAELLFERQQQRLLFATFVHQDNAIARAVWAAMESVHRPVVRHVLEQASHRQRRVCRG